MVVGAQRFLVRGHRLPLISFMIQEELFKFSGSEFLKVPVSTKQIFIPIK